MELRICDWHDCKSPATYQIKYTLDFTSRTRVVYCEKHAPIQWRCFSDREAVISPLYADKKHVELIKNPVEVR